MPSHIAGAVTPVVAWMKKVSHRNAPGAISAMAFIVNPVSPRVAFISTEVFSAIDSPYYFDCIDRKTSGEVASEVKVIGGGLNRPTHIFYGDDQKDDENLYLSRR